MTTRRIILLVIGAVILLGLCGFLSYLAINSLISTAVSNAMGGPAGQASASTVDSEALVAPADSEAVTAVVAQLSEYEDTASAEIALMGIYGFDNEQAADFNGGLNHWTSGHGSCGSPDRDPEQPEYCMFRYVVAEDTLVAFVIDATGVYFPNGDHASQFVITNEMPRSVKDGGLISVHSTMTEDEVALAMVSRLFWANRPGMSREDAINSGPTRSLAITYQMDR